MKQLLIALLLCILVQTVFSTSIPPPNVRYRITNNTNETIYKIVQIQSDTYNFQEYDTFSVKSDISNYKIRLFTDRGKITKKYHKLIVELGNKHLESEKFELLSNRQDYDLTINYKNILLTETNFFKRQKVISGLLVSFLLILVIKGIVYAIGLHSYLRNIYIEFLIINLIYSISLYFSINQWFKSNIPFFIIMLILTLIIGVAEYITYNIKLKFKNTLSVFISVLISSLLSGVVGGIVLVFVKAFT